MEKLGNMYPGPFVRVGGLNEATSLAHSQQDIEQNYTSKPELSRGLERLEKSVEVLLQSLGQLEQKLAPILRQEATAAAKNQGVTAGVNNTELGRQLSGSSVRIELAGEVVKDLLSRVEL